MYQFNIVFETIKSLRPHFHSLREIQNNVSLDIKVPLTWRYEDIAKPYRTVTIKIQDKNDKFNLVSFISQATQEGYDVVFACVEEIFKVNKEEEEKQKLFQEKVKELQKLFKTESLDKLKEINLIDNYGQEITTGVELVGQRDEEGSEGSGDTEEEDD
jgi:DNA/RNA-binding domain of Phe-tRNA-synthetase-like protein